ncbi:hypothetical protein RYX36_034828 [Vicia faba]
MSFGMPKRTNKTKHGGCETRPLNPTMVSDHHMLQTSNLNWNSIDPIAEENGGKRDEQRLSPGGPDGHHH